MYVEERDVHTQAESAIVDSVPRKSQKAFVLAADLIRRQRSSTEEEFRTAKGPASVWVVQGGVLTAHSGCHRGGEVMTGGRGGGRSTVVQKSIRNKLTRLLRIALEAARFARGPVHQGPRAVRLSHSHSHYWRPAARRFDSSHLPFSQLTHPRPPTRPRRLHLSHAATPHRRPLLFPLDHLDAASLLVRRRFCEVRVGLPQPPSFVAIQ